MSFEGEKSTALWHCGSQNHKGDGGMRRMAKLRKDDAMMRHPLKLIVDREEN
ncbi:MULTISPECIES: hypothetical protein [Serratia]|jgi:hypothetical protein|uniref:hypothetical protein n=1 Tax=Serratia TaxID=613 RepID=UPI000B17752D|nr:hypothetical protein [Serratia marcescens]HED2500961.1 hypothetical protein [Serratia marcescens]